jgi:hypothetical protein
VDIEAGLRRLQRRHAVVIIQRMKQRHMQHCWHRPLILAQPQGPPAGGIVIGRGPAIGPGHHPHAIGSQPKDATHLAIDDPGLQIGIACRLQIGIDRLEHLPARLPSVGPRQQRRQRMLIHPPAPIAHHQRHAVGRFGNQPNTSVHDRIPCKALVDEAGKAPIAPARRPQLAEAQQRMPAKRLSLGRRVCPATQEAADPVRHDDVLDFPAHPGNSQAGSY